MDETAISRPARPSVAPLSAGSDDGGTRPMRSIAAVNIGEPFGCDCGGTVLIGWRDWWPLPDKPHVPGVVIDMGDDGDDGRGEGA